jgi:hypothetical protein
MVAEPCEVGPVAVEYLVRAARVTDIARVVALSDHSMPMGRAGSPLGAGFRRSQPVHPTNGDRGGSRRASHDMNVPAELRDRAGRANPSLKESM